MFRVPSDRDAPTFDDTFKIGFFRWLVSKSADRKEWTRRRNAATTAWQQRKEADIHQWRDEKVAEHEAKQQAKRKQ